MKNLIVMGLVMTLIGCGQSQREPYSGQTGPIMVRSASTATGPIERACMASSRKGKSRQLCGCIQSAANQSLSRSQQSRAVKFYFDPHEAQETRQSDRRADEEFWKAYVAYGERAERQCG